jgi:predicted extracellular nuclease
LPFGSAGLAGQFSGVEDMRFKADEALLLDYNLAFGRASEASAT